MDGSPSRAGGAGHADGRGRRDGQRGWPALRPVGLVVADCVAWCGAVTAASILRVDGDVDALSLVGQLLVLPIAVACHLVAAAVSGLYGGRYRVGSFDEVAAVARTTALATIALFVIDALSGDPRLVPLSAVLAAGVFVIALSGGIRYVARRRAERAVRPRGATRVVVFGAGEGGAQVVTAMLRDPDSPYLPVALLDDDPAKQRLRVHGVRVVGTRDDVARVAAQHGASLLLVAIPRADRDLLSDLSDRVREAGLTMKVLPSTRELLDGTVKLRDIRDVAPSDLLGRREVRTEVESIAGYLTGKRVLVTGAGGSIGSELCRQILRFGPADLVMLDRDESALHAVQLSIERRALLDSSSLVLADIRDADVMRQVFAQHQPQVVFHAAALKHLPLLERFPREALRTNVLATAELLDLACAHGVERFVNISTDKAADPISVLGYAKRISERLTADAACRADGVFLSVRFGNVVGSRGSVLDTFQVQIAAGGPLTVTDPDVTRYFMTTAEAVELVVQAGGIGQPGEVLVLDMGEPVRIADVARRLADMAGPHVDVVFTGLRPGEKRDEVLFGAGERDERPNHPLIAQVAVPPLPASALTPAIEARTNQALVRELRDLCTAPAPAMVGVRTVA